MSTPSFLNLSTHYLDEGMRFAYGQRTLLGDSTFLPNISTYNGILTDDGALAVVAADKSGLAFAVKSTINILFGSQLVFSEIGLIMSNDMNGQLALLIFDT